MRHRAKWQPVEIDQAMDMRLQNWGDWRAREESPKRTHCASIEGRYRAPRAVGDDVDSVTRSPWRPLIDEVDAAFLDRVIKNPWFPQNEYAFLRAHYVLRAKRELVMRTIGQRRGDYLPYLARAVIIARNRVTVVEVQRAAASSPDLATNWQGATGATTPPFSRPLAHAGMTTKSDADNDPVVIIRKALTPGSHGLTVRPQFAAAPQACVQNPTTEEGAPR